MKKYNYTIAGHKVALEISDQRLADTLSNYAPFATESDDDVVFTIHVADGYTMPSDFTEEWRQEDEGQEILCGEIKGRPAFVFRWNREDGGCMVCERDYTDATLFLASRHRKASLDNAMMVMYALATARRGTLLFHSSTVCHDGKAYMFLGKSGTGKSTHSRLWLENVAGTTLVNDDNPVVRIDDDGTAKVYGSPWSGKTPCYRRVEHRLGGIVGLSQAPRNEIRRMKGIEAYALISSSISGKRWDKSIADGLHDTINRLAIGVPTWHLNCLPNAEAALTCKKTICEAI